MSKLSITFSIEFTQSNSRVKHIFVTKLQDILRLF
jgi:hypothetical protein